MADYRVKEVEQCLFWGGTVTLYITIARISSMGRYLMPAMMVLILLLSPAFISGISMSKCGLKSGCSKDI